MKAANGPRTIDELNDRASSPGEGVLECLRAAEGDFLVLGAGGKMGLHLCLMLKRGLATLGKGNRVIGVSRFGERGSRDAFDSLGIETIGCDLASEEELRSLPGAPNVFFLAGIKFGTTGSRELLRTMNVEMPALVAERFKESRIVALSTGCVYPFVTPESGGAREEDDAGPVGDYAISCLEREGAFAGGGKRNGTRTSLIRLNYSVDLRYGVVVDIGQRVAAGEPVDIGMGWVNIIWQGDALAHIVRSLDYCGAPPFVLNVTGSQVLGVRDIANRFGRIFQKPVKLTGEEHSTAWLSNATKSHLLFGAPAVGEDELIEWVGEWLKLGGETLGKPTHFEKRDGNY